MAKMAFLLSERIDRAKDGRTQNWIIEKLNEKGVKMNDSLFSKKKKGVLFQFTETELAALSEILGTDLNK